MKHETILNKTIVKTKREKLVEKMVTTFGDVELDRDEKSFLSLGPDYSMFDDLKLDKIEKEIQITVSFWWRPDETVSALWIT